MLEWEEQYNHYTSQILQEVEAGQHPNWNDIAERSLMYEIY
jgi:hypothetical protein